MPHFEVGCNPSGEKLKNKLKPKDNVAPKGEGEGGHLLEVEGYALTSTDVDRGTLRGPGLTSIL
jgi:hypothetical protein